MPVKKIVIDWLIEIVLHSKVQTACL